MATLLSALGSEVIKDKRFIREPDVGVVARFIEHNTAQLDKFDSARIFQKALHSPSEPWLFCTREQNLTEQFEEICLRLPPGNDFLLLQGAAADYKLVPGYQLSTWPSTQPPAPSPGSSHRAAVPTSGTATALPTKEKNASQAAVLAQESAAEFLIELVDNVGRRVTLLTYLLILCTICGLASVGVAALWVRGVILESRKLADPRLSSLAADIAAQATLSAMPGAARVPEIPAVPAAGGFAQDKNKSITIESERATVEAVRIKHCTTQKSAQFRSQLTELNPDLDSDVLRKGTKIRLPAECS